MSRKVKPTKRKVKAKAKRSAVRTTTKRADASARQRELEGRLAEAEAQQAATSEILRIISGSRGDVQPVFDAIVDSAARLCEAEFSAVARLDDDGLLYLAAISNMSPAETEAYHSLFPRPARRDFVIGRAFVDGRPVHIEDVLIDPEYDPRTLAVLQRAATYRTYLGIPLLRNGEPIGAIGCGRRKVKAFTETQIELVKTFAEQAVIAIENVRQFKELEVRNRALTESLDQQTATSEILRVISGSRVDVEPVFDVIVQSAGRLLGGHTALVTRILGDEIHLAAITSTDRSGDNAQRATWPRPVIGPTLHNEVIAQLAPRMSADVSSDPARTPSEAMVARSRGYRSIVVVPLLRDGLALGTLGVTRPTPGSFSDAEIALLQTFADQAVIAIENVRLFTEVEARNRDLTETLEQQTASGEILRVISSSPTDVQPVFDTVVESAARLCESLDTVIFLRDGDRLRLAAHHGQIPVQSTLPLIRETSNGRAILDGRTIHIEDMQHETDEYAVGRENARRMGHRTILCVPMMREGVAIGTIQLRRSEPRLFAPRQVALLETFADQAVIAIENVRLFKELQARNHDLTETLEQQTATGEILRVISASPTDVQPVFDTIAQSAARLCEGERCFVFRFEDGALHFVAYHGVSPEGARAVASTWPAPPTRGSAVGRAVLDGSVAHIPDVQEDLEYELGAVASAADFRSMVAVPMQRDGLPVGAISVLRPQPGRFSTRQIDLLKTFADQAVIAIENVRLFKELEARNRDLTASGEILRVISSSPTEVQPVFETIAASARRLCDASQTAVHTYDGSLVHLSAFDQFDPESAENLRLAFPMTPSGASAAARAILHRALVHIPDVLEYPEYALAAAARTSGFRSVISVPMLRDGSPIGALTVTKETPGAFPDNQIQLLKTFADQAVIAIQNVRLFTELEARNSELRILLEQQTATSEVLKVISRSAFDLDPVLQNVIESATRLCGATRGHIFRLDGDVLRFAAAYGAWPGFTDYLEQNPVRPGPGSVAGRAALERRTIHVVDVRQESGYQYEELLSRQDYRAVLAVPMLREGVLLGVIVILKSTAEPFAPKQIELVTTFADQAVIAIENVRLFSELQASNSDLKVSLEQQTATSELLKVIGRSTFDLEAVFEALAESAVRLCNAERGVIMRFDGQVLRFAVGHNVSAELRGFFEQNPIPLARNTNAGRAAFTRQTVHNHDVLSDPEYGYGGARVDPYRTVLAIPMLRADEVLGVIIIYRHEVRPFTDNQVALMETFADQAVIAIENVRLFSELQASNSDLKVSLEQQTATSELLKVIGGSTFDLQPVFETLAENAYRLCEAQQAAVFRLDGSVLRVVATYNASPELRAFFERTPIAPGRGSVSGRAALEGRTVHILDVRDDPEFTWGQLLEVSTTLRSVLAVPMIRGGEVLGVIAVNRHEVRPFTESQVALLETFADQAAIAIENARLLNELQERTTQLTHSVGELQALGEVSQAVGSTLDLEAVLATIVSRAVELSGSDQGIVYEFDEAAQVFHQRATHQVTAEYLEAVRTAPIRLGEGVIGRVGVTREPLQITDIEADLQLVAPQVRRFLTQDGMRSLLAVPLIREDRLLGGIVILRRQRGAFSPDVIATLQSFATQSVLAIHNARLFREIQRQKQYADALVETSPVAIVTMDLEGVVMGWNPGAERLFGYTQDEAMGRELAVLVTTPEAREEVRGAIRQTLTGERYRSITRRWRKDGTIVDVETSAKFVVVEGVQVGLIAIYHDITELLQARREAETANEAKSAFLATMSHEIRTPMNAVIGMSGLLLNTALTDEQREYAEIVRQSGDALLTVINDILDFSKIEAGKLEMESQPFDLRECVEGALDLVATRAAEKGLDLAYLLGDATPAGIVGDVTRLRQVLLNLLSNAVKFTESGEVVLSVSSQPIAGTEAHELTFSVRDTGIGIAPERLDRLFQSFSQVDASTTRRYGGTGLGLAISQRLTELMGGRISVASEVGVGSEFRFTIKAAPALVPVPTRRDLSGVQPSLRGKRVLVVDDNATNRRILTTHLGAWGMHARATESPIEALEWVRGGEGFDIGILDMHMPEMDGVALSRAIREHRAHDAFPLVLFTSLGRRESRADSEGFAAYLHKPIKPSQLFDALVSVLAEQPIHVQARGTIRTELDPEMATRHPLRILLAEDNVVNQKVAIRLLGQMGYRADVAGNGIEAVDAIARQKYDVVLMDVQMPELDGFGASREINRRWPGTRPRIVAMTANAMQGDRELCEAAGMDDYVAKPIRVEELVAALERIRPRLDAAHSDPVATGAPAAAGSGSGDGASSIDAAVIDALAATMGGAFIAELIDTFGEDARELIATLQQGLAAGDVDVFRRAAHSLKSTSETLGARRLAAMARELETLARSGAIGGTEERVERLAAEYATAAERLKEVRRDLPA